MLEKVQCRGSKETIVFMNHKYISKLTQTSVLPQFLHKEAATAPVNLSKQGEQQLFREKSGISSQYKLYDRKFSVVVDRMW